MTAKTLQDLFDIAITKTAEQGKISMDFTDGLCLYRHPNGCQCAVGRLIDNEFYHESFDNNATTAKELPILVAVQKSHPELSIDIDDVLLQEFLEALQDAHDKSAKNPSDFRQSFLRRATRVAKEFELSMPPLDS